MPSLLDLLRHKSELFGLPAPTFTWIAALILTLFTFGCLIIFWWKVTMRVRLCRATVVSLRRLAKEFAPGPGEGVSIGGLDAMAKILEGSPEFGDAWTRLSSQRILRRSARGEEQIWLSQGAESAFSDAAVIDSQMNRSFYTAIPGVVTGSGLLFTFLAILVALLDVRINENRVQGLELLIQGLSGKFVSSIAALFAATIYLLFEKPLQYKLSRGRHELVAALDGCIPVLSPTQILVDLTRDIGEQSTAFRSFNADLSGRLKQSFSESMGPTLVRMVSAIDDLNQLLRAAEAQKQESITGSLEGLLNRLEASMTGALSQMGNRFQESLSGGAMSQFQKVTDSLSGAASLLERMNVQFMTTQEKFAQVVDLAKESTSAQAQLGRAQIEELTEVLRGLMAEMKETASTSADRMNRTLATVVQQLSQEVSGLSDKMTSSIIDSAGLATGAASEVIAKADRWSNQSAEQLRQLLETHHAQLDTVKSLRLALEQSLIEFNTALERYGKVSSSVEQVVANVSGAARSLADTAKSARETHEAAQRIAGLANSQLEHLATANTDQREVWRQIHQSMEQYRNLFSRVEAEASGLLTQIGQHLQNYVQTTQQGFEGLVKVSDEHFTNATKRLAGSVNDLNEVLEMMIDGLPKARNDRDGR
jgi:DNA anti-recombination protein RmuC